MTDISLTTGMPELPSSDMYWRVEERDTSGFYFSPVELAIKVTIRQRVQMRETTTRQFLWFKRDVLGDVRVVETQLWSTSIREEIDGEMVNVPLKNVTPEMVRLVAVRCLAEYQDYEAARKLLGDYPPKKLEV